jgi:hypothetical protein
MKMTIRSTRLLNFMYIHICYVISIIIVTLAHIKDHSALQLLALHLLKDARELIHLCKSVVRLDNAPLSELQRLNSILAVTHSNTNNAQCLRDHDLRECCGNRLQFTFGQTDDDERASIA